MSFCEQCGTHIPDDRVRCDACSTPAAAPAKSSAGLIPLIILAVMIALMTGFFAAAILLGSSSGAEESDTVTLSEWSGTTVSSAAVSDGVTGISLTRADADEVMANVQPEPEPGTLISSDGKVHSYEIILADLSWEEACEVAAQRGGYLATITSQEEYEIICELAEEAASDSKLRYLWLGASVGSDGWTGDDCWITGESWSFENWYPGEPSGNDEDGTEESCLCMWHVGDTGWTFNDQRNDLLSAAASIAGKIGIVIEYES